MNKAAIYVFRNAECMRFGFTMVSQYFKTRGDAESYAKTLGHKFFKIVDFDDSGNNDSDEEAKRRGGAW